VSGTSAEAAARSWHRRCSQRTMVRVRQNYWASFRPAQTESSLWRTSQGLLDRGLGVVSRDAGRRRVLMQSGIVYQAYRPWAPPRRGTVSGLFSYPCGPIATETKGSGQAQGMGAARMVLGYVVGPGCSGLTQQTTTKFDPGFIRIAHWASPIMWNMLGIARQTAVVPQIPEIIGRAIMRANPPGASREWRASRRIMSVFRRDRGAPQWGVGINSGSARPLQQMRAPGIPGFRPEIGSGENHYFGRPFGDFYRPLEQPYHRRPWHFPAGQEQKTMDKPTNSGRRRPGLEATKRRLGPQSG